MAFHAGTSGLVGASDPLMNDDHGEGWSTEGHSHTLLKARNDDLMLKLAELERQNHSYQQQLLTQANGSARNTTSGNLSPGISPSIPPPPVVHVTYPSPPPRLGVFTGQKPRGGNEIEFSEWHARCKAYLSEHFKVDVSEQTQRIRASLKGIAYEHVKLLSNPHDILKALSDLFGSLLTEEDRYARFVKMTPERKEPASTFYGRLWDAFLYINQDHTFSPTQMYSKVYHTFMSNISSTDNLLMVELRTRFGLPGECAPDCAAVLSFLRSYQERSAVRPPVFAAAAVNRSVETSGVEPLDYDKLASLVADKLRTSTPPPNPPTHVSSQARRKPDFSFPCLNCGGFGHWKSSCTNPANPTQVKASKQSIRNKSTSRLNYH